MRTVEGRVLAACGAARLVVLTKECATNANETKLNNRAIDRGTGKNSSSLWSFKG
jgi:hypothetical protein